MWHKVVHDNDPADEFVIEGQLKEYKLGEETPVKPKGFEKDGGMLITFHQSVLLTAWESVFDSKVSPVFSIYKYKETEVELYHTERIPLQPVGTYFHNCRIFLPPGRYYFQLLDGSFGYVTSSLFNPEHCFVSFNSGYKGKDVPLWSDTPISSDWFYFYNFCVKIRKSDLYLGFQTSRFKDDQLLDSAFYHAPDDNNELRTYIYAKNSQYYEGQII